MTVEEAASKLYAELGRNNVQAVGTNQKDKIVVYTFRPWPTRQRLATYEGFNVEYVTIGRLEIKRSRDGGI
jgi:hypothetical protein